MRADGMTRSDADRLLLSADSVARRAKDPVLAGKAATVAAVLSRADALGVDARHVTILGRLHADTIAVASEAGLWGRVVRAFERLRNADSALWDRPVSVRMAGRFTLAVDDLVFASDYCVGLATDDRRAAYAGVDRARLAVIAGAANITVANERAREILEDGKARLAGLYGLLHSIVGDLPEPE